MKRDKRSQTIFSPEEGWESRTWYVVEASMNPCNPIFTCLFYSGFINGTNKGPGGYNGLVIDGYNHERTEISKVYYMKVLKKLISIVETDGLSHNIFKLPKEILNINYFSYEI